LTVTTLVIKYNAQILLHF